MTVLSDNCDNCGTPFRGVTIGGVAPPLSADGTQELACPDEGVAVVEPAFEDSADCCRATKRLGPLCDDEGNPIVDDATGEPVKWWTLKAVTNGDGKEVCTWTPDLAVLLENANTSTAARVCQWVAANCAEAIGAALVAVPTFITSLINALFPALCARIFSLTDFDSEAGDPVCDPAGACFQLFRDTALIDDDCPGGRVTNACVNGVMVCFGGSGSGGDPGGDPTCTVDMASALVSPAGLVNHPTCPFNAALATAGNCTPSSGGNAVWIPFDITGGAASLVLSAADQLAPNAFGDTYDIAITDQAGGTFPFTITGLTGASTLFANVPYTASTATCAAGLPGVHTGVEKPGGTTNATVAFDVSGLADGTYWIAIASPRDTCFTLSCA